MSILTVKTGKGLTIVGDSCEECLQYFYNFLKDLTILELKRCAVKQNAENKDCLYYECIFNKQFENFKKKYDYKIHADLNTDHMTNIYKLTTITEDILKDWLNIFNIDDYKELNSYFPTNREILYLKDFNICRLYATLFPVYNTDDISDITAFLNYNWYYEDNIKPIKYALDLHFFSNKSI